MEKNLRKNFIWNIIGTGFNSINSLIFLIFVTRINGVDQAGIFTIAFSTACVLYVIGTYAGRVYQVTDVNKNITDKDYLINRLISFGLMLISIVIFCVIKKYDFYKSLIFALLVCYKGFEAISDCIYGIMQKNDCLYKVGQSYFIKSICGLLVFIIVDYCTRNLIYTCLAFALVWLLIIFIFDLPFVRKYIKKEDKVNMKNVLSIFKSGFFIFIITFMGIYIINAQKYAIDNYLDNSFQTIFGIIIMPSTAICLFGQFLIHPYLTTILKYYQEKQIKELKSLILKINMYIVGIGAISAIAAYLIGIPFLSFIYKIDLTNYRIDLVLIILGAILYNIGSFYSYVLITIRKNFIQFVIYIITTIFTLIISNIFTKKIGVDGATYAYLITMILFSVLYIISSNIILNKKIKELEN